MSLQNLKVGDKFRIGNLEFAVNEIDREFLISYEDGSPDGDKAAVVATADSLGAMGAQIITPEVYTIHITTGSGGTPGAHVEYQPKPEGLMSGAAVEAAHNIEKGLWKDIEAGLKKDLTPNPFLALIPTEALPTGVEMVEVDGRPVWRLKYSAAVQSTRCECGSASVGVSKHSDWCPMHGAE